MPAASQARRWGTGHPHQAAPSEHLVPLPMSKSALEYVCRMGLLTPTRLACIPVLETPPRDPPMPTHAPAAVRREVAPGIAHILRHIHSPHRSTTRPPPLPTDVMVAPQQCVGHAKETVQVARDSCAPQGFQGLLRRDPWPPHLSPMARIMRWSPAVTSGWHSKKPSLMTDWSPACTSGDGEDDTQDPRQHTLLPIILAPMFAAAAASRTSSHPRGFPPRAAQMRVQHADLSEYTVPLEAMPGSPEAQCPSEIGHISRGRSCSFQLSGFSRVGDLVASFLPTECSGGRGMWGISGKPLKRAIWNTPGLLAGLTTCLRFSSVSDGACVACCLFLLTGSCHVVSQPHRPSTATCVDPRR